MKSNNVKECADLLSRILHDLEDLVKMEGFPDFCARLDSNLKANKKQTNENDAVSTTRKDKPLWKANQKRSSAEVFDVRSNGVEKQMKASPDQLTGNQALPDEGTGHSISEDNLAAAISNKHVPRRIIKVVKRESVFVQPWTKKQDKMLNEGHAKGQSWASIANSMKGHSADACRARWGKLSKENK